MLSSKQKMPASAQPTKQRQHKAQIGGLRSPNNVPRHSMYPLLDSKYLQFGTIYPYLRVQGESWKIHRTSRATSGAAAAPVTTHKVKHEHEAQDLQSHTPRWQSLQTAIATENFFTHNQASEARINERHLDTQCPAS